MTSHSRVLVVDDEKFIQSMLKRSLEDEYEIRSAFNGYECMDVAKEWHPDVILLDVDMPKQNGYEVCDKLKHLDSTKDIPVIFLTSSCTLDDRMQGFDVGAYDYLDKNYSMDELKIKLQRVSSYAKEKQDLIESADSANRTALEAMSTNYELGKAVRFAERALSAWSIELLGEYLMDFMTDMELQASVMFVTREGEKYYTTCSSITPLEIELMQSVLGGQRFTDYGCRTLISYPNVVLLVKNMPLEDPSLYGRLKDAFPFVLDNADVRVRMLDGEGLFMQQSVELAASVLKAREILSNLHDNFKANFEGVSEVMTEFMSNMSIDLISMGLDEAQEKFVFERVDAVSEKLHKSLLRSDGIEEDLKSIVTVLENITAEQNEIFQRLFYAKEKQEVSKDDDIELF